MKLQLRYLATGSGIPGGAIVLTDENGVMLPGQQSVAIDQTLEALTTVTVVFVINGKDICLEFSEPVAE